MTFPPDKVEDKFLKEFVNKRLSLFPKDIPQKENFGINLNNQAQN